MGIRHSLGALSLNAIDKIYLSDISEISLNNAKEALANHPGLGKVSFILISELAEKKIDIIIIASTASNRIQVCELALSMNPKAILIEKPLGQSYAEVEEIVNFFKDKKIYVCVNLNMRQYSFVKQLKEDLNNFSQFKGEKNIVFNGGALGIGANGIHYLDLIFFLLGAEYAELISGEIEPTTIPSGRGKDFCDFGGWARINFFHESGHKLGNAYLSLSSTSSAFGGWDLIGSHGRIRLNELEGKRVDILRKEGSNMPINRYAVDYLPPIVQPIESPSLTDLTKEWIEGVLQDKMILPQLEDSLKVHRLMFQWLSLSETYKIFPIT